MSSQVAPATSSQAAHISDEEEAVFNMELPPWCQVRLKPNRPSRREAAAKQHHHASLGA